MDDKGGRIEGKIPDISEFASQVSYSNKGYIKYRERVDSIKRTVEQIESHRIDEAAEHSSFGRWTRLESAIAIVNFFVNERREGGCYDFPESSLMQLKENIAILEQALNGGLVPEDRLEIANQALDNGKYILETSSTLQINSL